MLKYLQSTHTELDAYLGANLSHRLKICCSPSSTFPLLFLALFVTPSFMIPHLSMLPVPPSQVTTPLSVLPPWFSHCMLLTS